MWAHVCVCNSFNKLCPYHFVVRKRLIYIYKHILLRLNVFLRPCSPSVSVLHSLDQTTVWFQAGTPLGGRIGSWLASVHQLLGKRSATGRWPLSLQLEWWCLRPPVCQACYWQDFHRTYLPHLDCVYFLACLYIHGVNIFRVSNWYLEYQILRCQFYVTLFFYTFVSQLIIL